MHINKAKKIVIKLGSSTVVDRKGNFKKKWLLSLIGGFFGLSRKYVKNNIGIPIKLDSSKSIDQLKN